jgi:hypothetical protein
MRQVRPAQNQHRTVQAWLGRQRGRAQYRAETDAHQRDAVGIHFGLALQPVHRAAHIPVA